MQPPICSLSLIRLKSLFFPDGWHVTIAYSIIISLIFFSLRSTFLAVRFSYCLFCLKCFHQRCISCNKDVLIYLPRIYLSCCFNLEMLINCWASKLAALPFPLKLPCLKWLLDDREKSNAILQPGNFLRTKKTSLGNEIGQIQFCPFDLKPWLPVEKVLAIKLNSLAQWRRTEQVWEVVCHLA